MTTKMVTGTTPLSLLLEEDRCLVTSFFKLILALLSLSWCVRQGGQSCFRRFRFLTFLSWYPQKEHNWLETNVFDRVITCSPYHLDLYSNTIRNCDHDTSLITFANLWCFNVFYIGKSSILITSWSLVILVDVLS